MKKMWVFIVGVGCLNAMDRHAVHSVDLGAPLREYQPAISSISFLKVPHQEVVRLAELINALALCDSGVWALTSEQFARKNLAQVYHAIYDGRSLPHDTRSHPSRRQLIEETARTIEGMLGYLNDLVARS